MTGRENFLAILDRDLNKDRKQFFLLQGNGKDSTVCIYNNEKGPHSFIYSDLFKIYYYKIPSSVANL